MKAKTKALVFNIALPLITGAVSAYISREGMMGFKNLAQPPLSPPAVLFPIVWTILYILMGIAAYLVQVSGDRNSDSALTLYYVQLGFNFLWSVFFFKFGLYYFALLWLVILWVLIAMTMKAFSKISKISAYLLAPYIIWVSFAAYLNLGTAILN